MGIDTITFPFITSPGANLIGPIHSLADALSREGGSLKEIWVSREIYDMLTYEITRRDEFVDGKPTDKNRWLNGLIVIHTQSGRVKIRRADEE